MKLRGNNIEMVPGTAVSIPMDTVAAGYFTGVVDTPRRGPVAQMAAGTCYGREIVLVIIVNIHIIPPELIHNLSVKAERPFCSITKTGICCREYYSQFPCAIYRLCQFIPMKIFRLQ